MYLQFGQSPNPSAGQGHCNHIPFAQCGISISTNGPRSVDHEMSLVAMSNKKFHSKGFGHPFGSLQQGQKLIFHPIKISVRHRMPLIFPFDSKSSMQPTVLSFADVSIKLPQQITHLPQKNRNVFIVKKFGLDNPFVQFLNVTNISPLRMRIRHASHSTNVEQLSLRTISLSQFTWFGGLLLGHDRTSHGFGCCFPPTLEILDRT